MSIDSCIVVLWHFAFFCSFTDHGLIFFCSNLPEEFHHAFHSYLKSRAISSDVTNFLHAYMINKECHEYLAWLRKVKDLIKC